MPIEFPRPLLPARASRAVFVSARTAVVEWCSPRSFRTETGISWLIEQAATGKPGDHFWWVGPNYGTVASALGTVKKALTPGSFTEVPRSSAIVLLNGSTVWFRNAETPTPLYSDSVSAATVDGCVQIPEKSWLALRETLANTRAPARFISTVAGRDNWFNELARRTEAEPTPDLAFSRFTALDAIEEGILSQADLDYARGTLPDHIFRSMYLCEPFDDRVEAAHRAADPRLMTDIELAMIAGIAPEALDSTSDEELATLAAGNYNHG